MTETNEFKQNLIDKLSVEMNNRDMTKTDLAKFMGVHKSYAGKVLSGKATEKQLIAWLGKLGIQVNITMD